MATSATVVLVVSDDLQVSAELAAVLRAGHFTVREVTTVQASVASGHVAVCQLDHAGLAVAQTLSEAGVPVVLTSREPTIPLAVAALRSGAKDLVVDLHHLSAAVERLCAAPRAPGPEFLSGALGALLPLVRRVAASDAPVLLCGESGTGKELLARTLHERSPRADGPFVAINCAALPAALLEGELFGHVKGAFTDARSDRKGLFVQANGGSLFLDEVGELPLELQPKLLRALQERRVRPLGATGEQAFDARIIAATNKDLAAEVRAGRFREDLLYRLDVLRLELRPLRSRGGDVITLARFFLQRVAERTGVTPRHLTADADEQLLAWKWPGNVRELENCIERVSVVADGAEIHVGDLPTAMQSGRVSTAPPPGTRDGERFETLDEVVDHQLERALVSARGNKTRAAALLGVDRRTLYRMLERRVRH